MVTKPGNIVLLLSPFIHWIYFEIILNIVFYNDNISVDIVHVLSGLEFFIPVFIVFLTFLIFIKITDKKFTKYKVLLVAALFWAGCSYWYRMTKDYSSGFGYSAFKGIMIDNGILTQHGQFVKTTFFIHEIVTIFTCLMVYIILTNRIRKK